MEKSKKRRIERGGNLFVESLISGGIGLGVAVVALLLMPIALLPLKEPGTLLLPAVSAVVVLGGAACGVTASLRFCESSLAISLIGAGVILLPIIAVSLFVSGNFNIFNFALIALLIFASSVLSGLAVVRFRSSKKRSMKRAMKRR